MALRLKYAGIDAELAVERDLWPLARRPPSPAWTAAAACSRCPPTRRCSSCATCSPTAGWRGHGRADARSGTTSSARRTRPTSTLWRELADTARRAGARPRAAAPAAWRSTWRRAGHDVTGLDSDPELVEALRVRARERGLDVRGGRGRRAVVRPRHARFALVISPDAGGPAARRRRTAARDARRGAPRTWSPAGCSPRRSPTRSRAGPDEESLPPLPDVREQDGWVYSSTPVGVRRASDGFVIERTPPGGLARRRDSRRSCSTIELDP